MVLTINGEKRLLDAEVDTISDLLKHFQLEHKILVIELNREIVDRANYSNTHLLDGDQLEIVHFVGGG